MRISIVLVFFVVLNKSTYCQSDSIRQYANIQPLFQFIDSVSRNLEQRGKSVDLLFYSSMNSLQSGIVIWKSGKKYCGTYFEKEEDNAIKKNNISSRKIESILSSRLFSDSCDLCELVTGEKKANIDHEYIMYLKRNTRSTCNEMYFTNSSYLYYDSESCTYDVRELVARKATWPGKVIKKR